MAITELSKYTDGRAGGHVLWRLFLTKYLVCSCLLASLGAWVFHERTSGLSLEWGVLICLGHCSAFCYVVMFPRPLLQFPVPVCWPGCCSSFGGMAGASVGWMKLVLLNSASYAHIQRFLEIVGSGSRSCICFLKIVVEVRPDCQSTRIDSIPLELWVKTNLSLLSSFDQNIYHSDGKVSKITCLSQAMYEITQYQIKDFEPCGYNYFSQKGNHKRKEKVWW